MQNGTAWLSSPGRLRWGLGVRIPAGPGWLPSLAVWFHRGRTRRALRQLDDRALADIGISKAQRAAECRKWFWQP
ncbi:DUF1127 domain-containing protein [Reyranella sp. CPCC 100927]|nr:DUF1127 domain-containing protein [Reyranella sp. CPCC 100927]